MMASEASVGTRGAEADTSAWRSLEPASLLVNLVPDIWRTARAGWPLLLALLVGGGVANFVNLALLGVFLASSIGRTVLHFLTLRYRLHDGKLEIRTGLIGRRFRVIDPARIQNLEIVQNLFHKLAGLVELRIETAGESGAEGMLSALSVAEANLLRARLDQAQHGSAAVATGPAPEPLLSITLAELVGYGVSVGRVGAVVLGLGLAMEVLGQVSPERMAEGFTGLKSGAALGLLLLAMASGYAFTVGATILRHYGFRLFRSARGVRFEAGLLTRRGVEMALSKVQLVRVDEPWMRRLMGYGTLVVETAASGAPGEESTPEGVIPMVPTEDHAVLARVVLPHLDVDPWEVKLRPPAPRALVRGVIAGAVRWAAIGVALSVWAGPLAFLLVGVGILLAVLDWQRQGWLITERHIVSRAGFLTRRTWIVPREKIQSVHRVSDPLMRRYGLARVRVWVAGSSVGLPALREEEAAEVFDALTRRSRSGAPERLADDPSEPAPESQPLPAAALPEGDLTDDPTDEVTAGS